MASHHAESVSLLWEQSEDIADYFELGDIIGDGQWGVVYEARDRVTGELFACKTIAKNKLKSAEDIEHLRKEILIMHTLIGVDDCVQLKVTFEDDTTVYLIMELCTGGELFERVTSYEKYSEKSVARLFRSILRLIAACHSMGVVHRDLKPENFLLSDRSDEPTLKVADFGLSAFWKEGQARTAATGGHISVLTEFVGTVDYMSPELIKRAYGPETDVWSAGVILYCLLSGCYPFFGNSFKTIMQGILYNEVEFKYAPWPHVSEGAKDIIRRCLDKNPKTRITAKEALEHEWVREGGAALERQLAPEVLTRFKTFAAMPPLKKLGLMLLVRHLHAEEIEGLRRIFVDMDVDGSGGLSAEELAAGLQRHGAHLESPDEVERLLEMMDVQGDGFLDYEEFLAATVHVSKAASEANLFKAFAELDVDGDGLVTADEVAEKLRELGMGEVNLGIVRAMITDNDVNGDDQIDYLEFLHVMAPELAQRWGHEEAHESYLRRRKGLRKQPSSLVRVPSLPSFSWGSSSHCDSPLDPARPPSVRRSHMLGVGGSSIGGSNAPALQRWPPPNSPPPSPLQYEKAQPPSPAAGAAAAKRQATCDSGGQQYAPATSRKSSMSAAGADWRTLPTSAKNVVTGAGGRDALSRRLTAGRSVAGFCWADGELIVGAPARGASTGSAAGSRGEHAMPPSPPPNESRAHNRGDTTDTVGMSTGSSGGEAPANPHGDVVYMTV